MTLFNRALLPHSLRMLVDLLGEEATLRLVEARGGTRLVVPMHVSIEHMLFDILGAEAFARLVSERGGEHLQLPKADKMLQQHKHRAVLHMYFNEHIPVPDIALQLGYTRTRVYQIINTATDGLPVTGDLFADADDEQASEYL